MKLRKVCLSSASLNSTTEVRLLTVRHITASRNTDLNCPTQLHMHERDKELRLDIGSVNLLGIDRLHVNADVELMSSTA